GGRGGQPPKRSPGERARPPFRSPRVLRGPGFGTSPEGEKHLRSDPPRRPRPEAGMESVEIAPLETERFERVLGSDRYRAFARSMEKAVDCFGDRVLWCVNSAAKGGGVAELLSSMMGYLSGAGIDARWAVIEGDDDFFALTKR